MESPHRRVRASDGEREEYAQIVRAAMGEGRLDLDTGEQRLAAVYAATFRDELDPLIGDLPRGALFATPEFRDRERRHMRRHAGRVVALAALLTGIWLVVAVVAQPTFFWPIIPIVLLMAGLRRHRSHHRWHAEGPPWRHAGSTPPWQHAGKTPPWQHS
jgi:hypothetical protein